MALPPKSRRSGGPRTAQGKMVAAQNSIKTGAYVKQEVLPGEDLQEFEELKLCFIDDFKPQGVTEIALVHELVVLSWKKLRLERVEFRVTQERLRQELSAYDIKTAGNIGYCPIGADRFISNPELIKGYGDIKILREKRECFEGLLEEGSTEAALESLQEDSPISFKHIKQNLADADFDVSTLALMVDARWEGDEVAALYKMAKYFIDQVTPILWAHDHCDQIMRARAQALDQRLMDLLSIERPKRVMDDLSRSFFKTLAELRKQQEWRYRRDLIDLIPDAPELPYPKPRKK